MPYIGNIVQDFSVSTAMLNTDSVTSIKIDDGTIVNADISDSAAIAVSKLSGVMPSAGGTFSGDVSFGDNNITNVGTIALDTIKGDADDNTNINFAGSDIVNIKPAGTTRLSINTSGVVVTGSASATGNISSSGTIAANGGSIFVTGTSPALFFTDTDDNPDYYLQDQNGTFRLVDNTNTTELLTANATTLVSKVNHDFSAGIDVTGDITGTSDLTLTGSDKKFISTSSSSGDYVRLYAGSGTGKWDIYGNGANLRFSDNDSAGKVVIDTELQSANFTISSANPSITFTENDQDPDFGILCNGGQFRLQDVSAPANLFTASATALNSVIHHDFGAGIDVTGAITATTNITATGNIVSSSGQISVSDDGGSHYLSVGANADLKIYHDDGGPSIISDGANQGVKVSLKELNITEYTGNTTHVFIDTNGKVGIGTTSPEGVGLDITKSRTNDYGATTDNRNLAHLIARNSSDAAGRFASISLISGAGTQAEGSINLVQTANYAGDLTFKLRSAVSTWAERMRIKSDGKISIGGNAKAKKLTVVADGASQSGANDGTITDALVMFYGGKQTVVNSDLTLDETILHLKGQITDSGTSSTGEHTTNKIVFSGRRATGAQCWIEHTTDWNYSTQNAGGNLIFKTSPLSSNGSTAPIQRMVIHNDGAVVVNDTGDVGGGEGGVRLRNPDNGTCRFGASNSGNLTYIQFINGSSITGSISGGSSATSFNTTSDYRLKENESLISDGIARLKQLKPYRFNWKSDSSTIVDGFFAHEVSSIVPESITGTKDAVAVEDDVEKGLADAVGDPIYQSIDQAKLVPLLTAALQEEIAKREALETRIAALEAA